MNDSPREPRRFRTHIGSLASRLGLRLNSGTRSQAALVGLNYDCRISTCMTRGVLTAAMRSVDLTNPSTWEFSGFSQNGEDGILQVLLSQMSAPTKSFLEIGASDGIENNSTFLALACRFRGVMVDGNARKIEVARSGLQGRLTGVRFECTMVNRESAPRLLRSLPSLDVDVLSIDIDGVDWHVCSALLGAGLRPRIICVEYNSAFGPDLSVTIPDVRDFNYRNAHPSRLYYGSSIMGWRNLLESSGFRFVTVDTNGVNAFFVDPHHFSAPFLASITPLDFAENSAQLMKFGAGWKSQFHLIQDCAFLQVNR